MPAKVYLESPPFGDFRAMPARGGGFALLKWADLVPGQPRAGAADSDRRDSSLSNAENGEPLMLLDARSVTGAAMDRRSGGRGDDRARSRRRTDRRNNRFRAARRVDGTMPGGGGLWPRGLPRPACRGRRGARAGARLDRRFPGAGAPMRRGLLRHPGHRGCSRRGQPPRRTSPQHARRRRPGQGRGEHRRPGRRRARCSSATSGSRRPTGAS